MSTPSSSNSSTEAREVRPLRVCIVCAGNICRSPMAEAVLRTRLIAAGLANAVEVDSAGTAAWNIGSPATDRAVAAMTSRGYVSSHWARQFDPSWFLERDLVLALDSDNARDLRGLAPDASSRAKVRMLGSYAPTATAGDDPSAQERSQSVPDPYGGSDADFERTLDLIEAACDGLVVALTERLGS